MIISIHLEAPQPMVANRLVQLRSFYFVSLVCLGCIPTLAAQTNNSPDTPASKASSPQAGTAPATTPPRPAGAKSVPPQPVLPPIVHDFTSLLEPPTKNATAAQLKDIVAFVSSDKNHSYAATVETLAPDYVIVTNPVPVEETAVSVIIGSKEGGKPSISVGLSFAEVTKNVVITGDFTAITKVPVDVGCGGSSGCVVLLAADGETTIGQVTALKVSPSQLSVTYRAPATANPVSIRLQDAAAHYPVISLVPPTLGAAQDQNVQMRQVIAGDFCQKNQNADCATDFFKPEHPSRPGHPKDPHSAADPMNLVTGQYVLEAGDSVFQLAKLNALGPDTADISFSAPSSFKPAYLVLDTAKQSYRFAYTPAPPLNTKDLTYESDELSTICDQVADPSDASKKIPDCDHTPPERLSLRSISSGNEVGYVAMQGELIVARVEAPLGQEPDAVIVSNKITMKSIIARRTIKPGGNVNLLNVDMSIMDQTTALRNYGNRIAKRYIAVTLDVTNPTSKKVQFNKSAMYFDVDYVESREEGSTFGGFFQSVGEVSTLGLYQPSVYKPPFVAGSTKKEKTPRIARFGLEQNVKQAPENYLSVLGSFDYTTSKTDDKLKAVELVGSILTTIATGGVVADASGAFRAGTAIFSGTFLPGVRSIVLDTSFINRLRTNLVSQTLQETIQVPAKGSTSTIVLLPRTGILAFTDAQVPVMIKRVIDVHLVEEVVNEVTETPVTKNECTVGNTKDQTRQALGEPSGLTTNPDGSSSFSFSKGTIASADFNTKGLLVNCKSRTRTDQMDLARTLVEAKQTLTDLGVSANQIALTDGSTVMVDIPGVQKTYHFDAKGAIISAYSFLFKDITAEGNKSDETQAKFEAFLEEKATPLSAARSSEIKASNQDQKGNAVKATAGASLKYPSPDIQYGSITVTFKNSGTGESIRVVVDKITFQGDQPKNPN